MRAALTLTTLLIATTTAIAQPARRSVAPSDVTLSARVKPGLRPAAALPADTRMAIEVLTGPIRADQEAILVKLIAATPDSDVVEKAELLFRLGELYARQHRSYRLQAVEAELRGDARAAARTSSVARRYLRDAIVTYRALTEPPAFQVFAQMDLALFVYAYTLQSSGHVNEARAAYDKLLKNHPASRYVPEAHFAFAEHFFEAGQHDEAAARYERVLRFPATSVYWYAQYKIGWIQLHRAQHQAALESFLQVAQGTARDSKLAVLRRAALKDFVRAYAEIGKVDKALAAFRRVDGASALGMLETLAGLYLEQGKSDRAIAALRELMTTSPTHANVCLWQYQIAHATLSLPGASTSSKVHEIVNLARLYQHVTTRRTLPREQQSECRDNASAMSGELARAYHAEWAKTKDPQTLHAAATLYASHLATFPDAPDAARTRYYHAELLWTRAEAERDARRKTQLWEDAAEAFVAAVKTGGLDASLVAEAAYAGARAYLYARETDPRSTAESPAVDGTLPPTPRPLPDRDRKMLAAFDLFLAHEGKGAKEDDLVTVKLVKANLLRRHDHLPEAITQLRQLLARYPAHDVAEDAALLLLESLARQGDEPALLAATDELLAHPVLAKRPSLHGQLERVKTDLLRSAAAALARQAHASRDTKLFVRCGNAYLDIYNRDPEHAKNDEVLLNAGHCFEQAHSIGVAIRMYQLIERHYPTSPLARRAIARLGKAYADVAFYREASAKLEQYARTYASEPDAHDALSDAVFFYKGTGDDTKAIESTRFFIKTFGAKRPLEAANAAFSLTAIHEKQGDPRAVIAHLEDYIREHGARGGVARLVIAHARIAQLLHASSCPTSPVDGVCARVRRERAVARRNAARVTTQCGPESATELRVLTRDATRVRRALAHVADANRMFAKLPATDLDAALARHHVAQARLVEAGVALEAYLALDLPTNLDFDPRKPDVARKSLARFDRWFESKNAGARVASTQLAAVLALQDPASSIAAAARLGQVAQGFADALFTAEIPRSLRTGPFAEDQIAAYCDVLTDRAEPLARRALEAYGTCLERSTQLGWFSEWSRLCERELGQLEPDRFPTASERRAEPVHVATLTALEPPPRLD